MVYAAIISYMARNMLCRLCFNGDGIISISWHGISEGNLCRITAGMKRHLLASLEHQGPGDALYMAIIKTIISQTKMYKLMCRYTTKARHFVVYSICSLSCNEKATPDNISLIFVYRGMYLEHVGVPLYTCAEECEAATAWHSCMLNVFTS